MSRTKVITFRCDEDLLSKVDLAVAKHRYYKRSALIEASLMLAVMMDEKNLLRQLLSYRPRFDEVTKLEFEIKKKIPQ